MRFCFLCFLYEGVFFPPSILVPNLWVWLTVYVSFSNTLQLQSWVLLVKDLSCNRKYCGYTCIVVFEGQLKNDCNAETEKQKTWKKYFHIWKIELLCPSVLKSKSAYIKFIWVYFLLKCLHNLLLSLGRYVCYFLVLACKLCFLTFMIGDLLISSLWNFYPEWMKQRGLRSAWKGHRLKLTSGKGWRILSSLLLNLADLCSQVILHPIIVYILPAAWIGFEPWEQIDYSACTLRFTSVSFEAL